MGGLTERLAMIISLIVLNGRHITILSGSQRVADSVLAELVVSEVIGVERFILLVLIMGW